MGKTRILAPVRRRHRLILALALAAAAAVVTVARAQHATRGSTTVELSFHSRALSRQLHFKAYLPPGYATSGLRYPVVYFLHGLPASPEAYRNIEWLRTALDALPRGVILVAPQGSARDDGDPEYLDWGPGRNWETAIALELPRYVDTHLPAIPRRDGRAL